MKSFLIAFFFSVFLISASYSQKINTKKLDSLFERLQHRGLATGSVAFSIDGKIVYQRAIGFAMLNAPIKVPPDINTKYRIGSVTKMFTAVMIFQLIDEGKLSPKSK